MGAEELDAAVRRRQLLNADLAQWVSHSHELAVKKGWWSEPTVEEAAATTQLALIALQHWDMSKCAENVRIGENAPDEIPDLMALLDTLSREQVEDLAKMALIHSEISEAVEAIVQSRYTQTGGTMEHHKPEGAIVELGDAFIRMCDWAGRKALDLRRAVVDKHTYNATRPMRHGGKLA